MNHKTCKTCKECKPIESFGLVCPKKRKPFRRAHCIDCYAKNHKEYVRNNPDKIKKYNNSPKRKKYLKEFRSKYNSEYYEKNKKRIIKQHISYEKEKYKSDLNFRILRNLRTRFRFKTKQKNVSSKTREYLGCSLNSFKEHLESLFTEGMSWDNYGCKKGCWSIDHIKPCSAFNLNNENEIKECFNFKNCRPLWSEENSSKGGRF